MLALVGAILCHLALFYLLAEHSHREALEQPIEISFIPPSPPQKNPQKPVAAPAEEIRQKQFVSPSTNTEAPIQPTRLLSEHASKADVQKIKRGESETPPPPAPKPALKAQSESRESKAETAAKEDSPAKKSGGAPLLRLSDDELMASLDRSDAKEQSHSGKKSSGEKSSNQETDKQRIMRFQQSEPFKKSFMASLRLGSPDYLPEIQDGDVTLLNAKADHFAVFVRRVAIQVFGAIRSAGWQEMHYSEVQRIREFATVEAVMSLNGKLLEVKIIDSSGSTVFDALARRSAERGTWDQNPPADAAADDHKIHFIFKARSWVRQGASGIGEQRWLLLGTGLL